MKKSFYPFCRRCRCSLGYTGRGRPPKYCKACAKFMNNLKCMLRNRRKRSLGSSRLSEHRNPDFEIEMALVRDERNRLGI